MHIKNSIGHRTGKLQNSTSGHTGEDRMGVGLRPFRHTQLCNLPCKKYMVPLRSYQFSLLFIVDVYVETYRGLY